MKVHQRHPVISRVVLGLFIFLLAACGQNTNTPPAPTSDFAITLSQSTLESTVGAGGSFPLTIMVARTNFASEVTLALEGTGATATFNPATTSGANSTMTLSVGPSVAIGDYPLTVKASAGTITKTASLTLKVKAPPVTTVTGKVVGFLLEPLENITVTIGTASAVTNANGEFSISNVTVPYTAVMVDSGIGMVYQGLTRTNPTLQFLGSGGSPKSATMAGTLSGGAAFPNPANQRAVVTYSSESSLTNRLALLSGEGPAYSGLNVGWIGGDVLSGRLHALQWQFDANDLPTDYTGYGFKDISLANGGNFVSPQGDIALSDVNEATLSGNVILSPGLTLAGKILSVDFGPNATQGILQDMTPDQAFSYITPNLSSLTMTALSVACGTGCSGANNASIVYQAGLAPNASNVKLEHIALPTPSLPASGANNVAAGTPFSWSTASGGVHVVFVEVGSVDYYVVTASNEMTLPDLSAQGLPLPVGTGGRWFVLDVHPFASVDAATTEKGFLKDFALTVLGGLAPENSGAFAASLPVRFTTAP